MTLLTLPLCRFDERYGRLRLVVPSAERALRESLARVGQLHPLVVCVRDEQLALIDGFKRLHAARCLGLPTLWVRQLELSEAAAIAAVVTFNGQGRGLSDLEQAMCVRALVRDQGLTQVAVGELLGMDKSWVSRRLALVERLSETVADDVRAGLVTTTGARELSRVPRGNQPEVAAAITRVALTSREAAHLVALVEASSGESAYRVLLAHPREALEADRPSMTPMGRDPRLGPAANALSQRLCACLRTMSEVRDRVERTRPLRWSPAEQAVLSPLLERVCGVAELLVDKLRVMAPIEEPIP
jgi:ParB-like chromosome segregation protein Spo0J